MADKNSYLAYDFSDLPYSLETEQAIIGSILINPECVSVVLSNIKPDYFYIPQHKAIMDAIVLLDSTGSRIDALTVLDKLSADSSFDKENGKALLFHIAQSVPSAANVENYCKIVQDNFYIRRLIDISQDTIDSASSGIEADILNTNGDLDINEEVIEFLNGFRDRIAVYFYVDRYSVD